MRLVIYGIIIAGLFSVNTNSSRNLVSNPGFEDHTGCPDRNGDIKKCVSWSTTAPGSTPDYFHSCYESGSVSGTEIGVPLNSEGNREPVSGSGYIGMAVFFKKNYYSREYIQNKLLEPLQKGGKYRISFYISLSDSSEYASDHISIGFSIMPNAVMVDAPNPLLKVHRFVTIKNTEALTSRKWSRVEAEYTARGGEEYMIIGSFSANMNMKEYKRKLRKPLLECRNNECAAYYYIDEVSLIEVPSEKINPKFK